MKYLILSLILLCCSVFVRGQNQYSAEPSPILLKERWEAERIICPESSLYDYGVYHFRKTLTLDSQLGSFIINISADNRYRLFVSGKPVCRGPARGDTYHWYFDTVDIVSLLGPGKNVLAVLVWNFGSYTPGAQMTLKTGLIVQGNSSLEVQANTDKSWRVYHDPAYSPSIEYSQDVGCSDILNASLHPWGWENSDYNDIDWIEVRTIGRGQPYGIGSGYDWILCKGDIPFMEESLLRMSRIRRTGGIDLPSDFLKGRAELKVPANQKVSFFTDQNLLTMTYSELIVSGEKNSLVKFTYSEAMFKGGEEANRNEIKGRDVIGSMDKLYPDGGSNRLFRPLWFRTYQYIRLDIKTKDRPLVLHDLYGMYTGYSFKEDASFDYDLDFMKQIWEAGWRTARLHAHETYFDCPYYEQLQHMGDVCIQAPISLYVDGDDRLIRKVIKMYDYSRSYEGIMANRYPSRAPQYIPPFSLYWINMVHDYWMYCDDPAFVRNCTSGVKTILEWFANRVDKKTGTLGAILHWNFVGWPAQWPWSKDKPIGGVLPGGMTGESSILILQLAYVLKDAVELLDHFGEKDLAAQYGSLRISLCENIWEHCWVEKKQLLCDDILKTSYSQHANIMGILSDTIPVKLQQDLLTRLDTTSSLTQAAFYYRFYLSRALKKVGLADQYVSMLKPWQDMLGMGLTIFAENPEPSRSDCHAWSISPVLDFLVIICGVEPVEAGSRSVKVEPHLGCSNRVERKTLHSSGNISIILERENKGVNGKIVLPEGLSGCFIWNKQALALHSGQNLIDL